MAIYKVWLTVKDSYGNTKEVDGGTINVDLTNLTPDEIANIEGALPLDDYIRRDRLDIELDDWATDAEVEYAIDTNDAIKYSDFSLKPEE